MGMVGIYMMGAFLAYRFSEYLKILRITGSWLNSIWFA